MSMDYTIDRGNRVIICRAVKTVSLDEVLEYHRALVREEGDLAGMVEYVDMSGLEEMNVRYSTGHEIIMNYLDTLYPFLRGTIFYAPTELGFGMANMMASSAQAMAEDEKIHVLVVREPIAPENLHAKLDELLASGQ